MKLPRGFGKNYFSLDAITATVNGITLQKEASRVENFHFYGCDKDDSIEELEELEEAPCDGILQNSKGCHCNCFFQKQTRKVLQLFFISMELCAIFLTRKSSLSPPNFLI
jgi:hypothetical protein